MATKWMVMASLPVVFLIGALATINQRLAIAAIIVGILAFLVQNRFRALHSSHRTIGLQPELLIVFLPTAIALRTMSPKGSVFLLALLAAIAYVRKPDGSFKIKAVPLLLFLASCGIVFSRPAEPLDKITFLTLALVIALVFRLITTVDGRKIIAGLIDGCGLYTVANVVLYAAGFRSPAASNAQIGYFTDYTGFVRTLYPLANSINLPPIVAAFYVASVSFLILEAGAFRRSWRVLCLMAAVIVLIGAGTRSAMAAALVLPITVICLPVISRWLAQAATLFAAVSAFVLPKIVTSVQFAIAPLMDLAPDREQTGQVDSIHGRDYIWLRSIHFWTTHVRDVPHVLFGYGVDGQYRSGAASTYADVLSAMVKNYKYAYVHNSYLQQLFDGGVLGWLLLVVAAFWASARLAARIRDWGNWGLSAVVGMTVVQFSAMTEVSLTPGLTQEGFWLLLVLVAIACQKSGSEVNGHLENPGGAGTARQESRSVDSSNLAAHSARSISSAKSASMRDGAFETGSRGVLHPRGNPPTDRRELASHTELLCPRESNPQRTPDANPGSTA